MRTGGGGGVCREDGLGLGSSGRVEVGGWNPSQGPREGDEEGAWVQGENLAGSPAPVHLGPATAGCWEGGAQRTSPSLAQGLQDGAGGSCRDPVWGDRQEP